MKKAIISKEAIELILAAAALFVLAIFFYNLLSPNFDEQKETAKSYMLLFKKSLKEADESGKAEFSPLVLDDFSPQTLLEGDREEKTRYYLVYFDDKAVVDFLLEYLFLSFNGRGGANKFLHKANVEFVVSPKSNQLCFCSTDWAGRNPHCRVCEKLEAPLKDIKDPDKKGFAFSLERGDKIFIEKKSGFFYLNFSRSHDYYSSCETLSYKSPLLEKSKEILKGVFQEKEISDAYFLNCKNYCMLKTAAGRYGYSKQADYFYFEYPSNGQGRVRGSISGAKEKFANLPDDSDEKMKKYAKIFKFMEELGCYVQ